MPDPQPDFQRVKTEQEKHHDMVVTIVDIIDKTFKDAQKCLDEIDAQEVGKEDFPAAERAVSSMLSFRLKSLQDFAEVDQWPAGWAENAQRVITALINPKSELFLTHDIDQYTHTLEAQNFLTSVDNEETRKIVYLILHCQDPVLFRKDPDRHIQPSLTRLLSRLDPSRSEESSEPCILTPETVVEKLLSDPIILEKIPEAEIEE